MENDVQVLQRTLAEVEEVAEKLLLARHELVECDKARNGRREALTALRKQARTTGASLLIEEIGPDAKCRVCGDHDGSSPVWVMSPGADLFIRRPFHGVHRQLEKDQVDLEAKVKKLQGFVKEKTLELSDSGALADRFGPELLKAFVTLKDGSS